MPESALYQPVKAFLAARGYDAKGEIGHCDVVAVRRQETVAVRRQETVAVRRQEPVVARRPHNPAAPPQDPPILVIVELKLGLSLDLILQAVDRLPCADEVWLAVPATRKGRDRDPRARKLCRLLGFGLLAINLPRGTTEILAEPQPYRPRPNLRRRRALIAEHAKRQGDPSPGGTGGLPIMTAYRQEALACAARLREGPRPTKDLATITPRATNILYRNVYGWFERTARGIYQLTPEGQAALTLIPNP